MSKKALVAITACTALSLTACGPSADQENPAADPAPVRPSNDSAPESTPVPPTGREEASSRDVTGAKVRFSDGSTTVDVTLGEETPAVRDFVSMLPLSLDLEEYSGREKIATLPRELRREGTKGTAPEHGDLLYYVPWGNLGFYYTTDKAGYSEETLHLGTYNATLDELDRLEGRVRVDFAP